MVLSLSSATFAELCLEGMVRMAEAKRLRTDATVALEPGKMLQIGRVQFEPKHVRIGGDALPANGLWYYPTLFVTHIKVTVKIASKMPKMGNIKLII